MVHYSHLDAYCALDTNIQWLKNLNAYVDVLRSYPDHASFMQSSLNSFQMILYPDKVNQPKYKTHLHLNCSRRCSEQKFCKLNAKRPLK